MSEAQDSAQRLCKFTIRYGLWRHGVDRSTNRVVNQRVLHDAEQVIDGNPAHVLVPSAENPTGAELEWPQHLCQRSTQRAEDNPDTQMHDPYASLASRRDRGLPRVTYLGKKPASRRRQLIEDLATSIAVETDRGSSHCVASA